MPSFLSSLTSIFSNSSSHPSKSSPILPTGQRSDAFPNSPSLSTKGSPSNLQAGADGYRKYVSRYQRERDDGESRRSPSSESPHTLLHGGQGQNDSPTTSRPSSFIYPPGARGNADGGFQYPPPPNVYGYTSTSQAGGDSRRASRLDNSKFFSPHGPLNYYPPLAQTWTRIRNSLREAMPELEDSLNPPVDAASLAAFEPQIGLALPASVRDSYLCADGQDSMAECRQGLFFGLTLLTLEDVLSEWLLWRAVDDDAATNKNPDVLAMMASIPPKWIKPVYASRGWLPLVADKCGNYVGVDLDPDEEGTYGQVIVFGRDFDRKCVLWRGEGEGGWGRWLASFAEELESGEGWEIGGSGSRRGGDSSPDEEDDVGYSSYFFDGRGGAGDQYGETGGNIRLTGQYRGWNVMEAWWDRSVRRWDELGMGLQQEHLTLEEGGTAQSTDGASNASVSRRPSSAAASTHGLGFGGMRLSGAAEDAQVQIPVLEDPSAMVSIPTPLPLNSSSDVAEGSDAPRNPDRLSARVRSKLPVSASQRRLITPLSPTLDSPESARLLGPPSSSTTTANGLLSPTYHLSSGTNKRYSLPNGFVPAPSPIDLPTRADIQAAQAVAVAEQSGLRGGWVMSMEAAQNVAGGRTTADHESSTLPRRQSQVPLVGHSDSDMVDVDLEGGRMERMGSRSPGPEHSLSFERKRLSILETGSRLVGANRSRPPSRTSSPSDAPNRVQENLSGLRISTQPVDSTASVQLEPQVSATPVDAGSKGERASAPLPSMTIVVAATRAHGIGVGGSLPWRLPKEMKYFASVTTGNAAKETSEQNIVIMGRKTWEGIPPKFRPLKNRRNMVITRKGVELLESEKATTSTHSSLQAALDAAAEIRRASSIEPKVFLIGGAELYRLGIEMTEYSDVKVDRILLTRIIDPEFDECDVFFPDIEAAVREDGKTIWKKASHHELVNWTGQEVAEGETEEKGVKYRFEMWTHDD